MPSVLAWSRAFAFPLLLSTFTYAREESLFASSVTYCNPPETLLVQRFEIAYFPKNTSVVFNVSISSVQAHVNVSANLFLNVYGMNPVNVTLDLCNLFNGALCPLPMYNFTGADTLTLPPSLTVLKKIPAIAFKIPDLEGFGQLTLTEVNTGEVKACVQATLSNGWSAHQPAVEWSTASVALAALLSAGWHSIVSPEAMAPFRFLELIYLYQSIASSAFLSLNYPSLYRAFSLNFAWAVGLISSSTLQNSINRMRHITGGHLADATDGSAVGLVNRKLSPYNFFSVIQSVSIIPRELPLSFTRFSSPLDMGTVISNVRPVITGEVQTVTAASSNVLQAGVPIFVNTIHIATANAFMTVFIFVLCMFAIATGIFILGFGSIFILDRLRGPKRNGSVFHSFSSQLLSFVKGWFLRLSLLAALPLLIFTFYQWTLKDSWLSILLSVVTLIAIAALVAYPAFQTLRIARRESSFSLYAHNELHLFQKGPLYAQHRPPRYFFFLAFLIACLLRAIFIAFGQASGQAQLALMIVIEFSLVAVHLALKPFKTRGGNIFSTYLAITRLVCTTLMIAFIEKVNVKAIPRVVIGIIIAIIFSVSIIAVILNLALHTIGDLRGRQRGNLTPAGSSQGSMLEKGVGEGNKVPSDLEKRIPPGDEILDHPNDRFLGEGASHERPMNPTPNQSTMLNPYANNPYAISPTTTITTMDPPSIYSNDSGTITVGSLLPRRWSFSFSQPSSPVGSTIGHRERQHRPSSTPSPLPPSTPSDSGVLSRNASLRGHPSLQMPRHQHDDIEEESSATTSISPP